MSGKMNYRQKKQELKDPKKTFLRPHGSDRVSSSSKLRGYKMMFLYFVNETTFQEGPGKYLILILYVNIKIKK